MDEVRIGQTEISVSKHGFGALPIQRISEQEAIYLLQKAQAEGIRFFDTARFYTDSAEKIGKALKHVRTQLVFASKTMAQTPDDFRRALETTLKTLQTDYLDFYEFHNPAFCP